MPPCVGSVPPGALPGFPAPLMRSPTMLAERRRDHAHRTDARETHGDAAPRDGQRAAPVAGAPATQPLTPADLIGLLADAEWVSRENRKLTARLKAAKLKLPACVEDVDYRHPRGLTKTLLVDLGTSRWVATHQTVILTGATGLGKSYLACALAHKACRDGYTVAYRRLSRLFDELAQARADGTYLTALRRLAKVQVLVLDDFGLEPLGAAERKVLLEVLEDRYGLAATIITSQLDR